uniref:Uncharacterized protein n=1 Tax=Spongospora subterranea TaxID=70186 RepID=A0A0H5R878_9EUKA|eukprot:CRZ10335.1 hypothetical protein [Spongospora subterranea]
MTSGQTSLSPFVINDSSSLSSILKLAVSHAGLSVDDPPVKHAEDLLSNQFFMNAFTLRFKRQRTGGWDWLQLPPFLLPMCLADLIGHCLDQKVDSVQSCCQGFHIGSSSIGDACLADNAALAVLLGHSGKVTGSLSTRCNISAAFGSKNTPTLSSIRLDHNPSTGPLDFGCGMDLFDNCHGVTGLSLSPFKKRNSSPVRKSRHFSSHIRRRKANTVISGPRKQFSKASRRNPHRSESFSPKDKIAKKRTLTVKESPIETVPRRDGRDIRNTRTGRKSNLFKAMTAAAVMDEIVALPFNLGMIEAVPQCDISYSTSDGVTDSEETVDRGSRRSSTRSGRLTSSCYDMEKCKVDDDILEKKEIVIVRRKSKECNFVNDVFPEDIFPKRRTSTNGGTAVESV